MPKEARSIAGFITVTEILYSPLAEVRWAHLVEPRPQMDPEKPLAWSVDLLLPVAEPTSQAFLETLERQFIEAHGSKKRRSNKGEPWKPDKEQPSQLMVVKFKAQQLTRRDGSQAHGPRLIDARKHRWNGAAQVVHYVPYQESDPTQGFQEQEGYSQAEAALADPRPAACDPAQSHPRGPGGEHDRRSAPGNSNNGDARGRRDHRAHRRVARPGLAQRSGAHSGQRRRHRSGTPGGLSIPAPCKPRARWAARAFPATPCAARGWSRRNIRQ